MLLDVNQLPTITTERLRLRWLTIADVPALFEIFGDPTVCRYWSRPAFTSLADAVAYQREIVELFESRSLFQWGIAELATDHVIGTCTLAGLSSAHRRAEVGFALARHAWGQGYMTEAINALLTFAFETLDLHRIEADVDPRNHRSIAVLEHAGFRREGFLRERYHLAGEVQDAVFYGLLRSEYVRSAGSGTDA
jgi:ribosomal-protein-alanine N-acetyltransferase